MARSIDPEMLLSFVQEVQSYLPHIRHDVTRMSPDLPPEALHEAYRMAHTIKGAGSMVGLSAISHVAHYLEVALEDTMAGTLIPATEPTPVLLQMVDLIEAFVAVLEQEDVEEPFLVEAERLDRVLRGEAGRPPQKAPSSESETLSADEIPAELLEVFQLEAAEHLEAMAAALPVLASQPDNREALQEFRRCAHTLKGAAAMVGFRAVTQLAHRMEDVLDLLFDHKLTLTTDTFRLLASSTDALEDLASGKSPSLDHLYSSFDSLLSSLPPEPAETEWPPLDLEESLPDFEPPTLPTGRFPSMAPGAFGLPTPLPPKSRIEAPSLPSLSGGEPAEPEMAPLAEIPAELLEVFQLEAAEHLQAMAAALPVLESQPNDREALQEFRRCAHTLKGAAAMVGFRAVTQLAHRMEDVLDLLFDHKLTLTTDTFRLLASSTDALEDLASGKSPSLAHMYASFDTLLAPQTPELAQTESAPEVAEAQPEAEPALPAFTERRERFSESLDAIVKLVSEQVIARTAFEQRMGDFLRMIGELQPSTERLKRVSYKLETQYEASALGTSSPGVGPRNRLAQFFQGHGFDELEFDRYSEFHLLSRELAETTNDVQTLTGELGHLLGDFDSYLTQQSRLTSEIEEKLMRLRMIPLATLASRFHRTVRQVAQEVGKQVDLVLEGESTGLDKSVLEEMAEPLLHLLRNAVDHGIERPEARRARNKAERGRIVLKAAHEGSQVVLRLSDDGAGLDAGAIRTKAVEKGFVSAAEASVMGEEELFALIFQPGFSTAREVSEISGRGVGMDVVKTRVTRLKGTVSVESKVGIGTTFTVRLPLTLAITRALMVKANHETFAVPLGDVRQILRIDPSEIETVGDAPTIRVAGHVYPIVYLARALGLKQPADESVTRPPVLLLQAGDREVALVVDHLLGGREIVVKNLGSHLKRVAGVTGATVAGDGSVVLILNPVELVRQTRGRRAAPAAPARVQPTKVEHDWTILIVDDSPSVRRVVSNIVQRAGWKPVTAKNGLEALELLQRSVVPPDLILLDVEMPRMDGYDFLAAIRATEAYRNLPAVMLTSRAGEKHRKKALDLGASDYLVKPYEDEKLLGTIRRLVQGANQAVVV